MVDFSVQSQWQILTLREVLLKIVGGGTPSKSKLEYYQGDIPWMSVKDMNKNVLTDTVDHITKEAVENSSTNVIPAGTPIIATRMSLGKIVTAKFDSAINQDLKALFPSEQVILNYLIYWYRSNAKSIESLGTGTTVKGIRLEVLNGLVFPLPPLAEQKIIAEKLDTLLAQVETTKARLERIPLILKQFRQSVLAAAVSGKLTEEWRGENGYQYFDVELSWSHTVAAPSSWRKSVFSKEVKIIGGSQPPKSDFLFEPTDESIRLIQIRDYKSDKHIVYIPREKAKRFCSKTDIMIGRYGPPIFQILRGIEGAYNVALMKAEPFIANEIHQEYLFWFLQNRDLFNYIEAGSDRTAGQSGVNKKFLEQYPFFVPPIEEQKEVVSQIEKLFTYADKIEKQTQNALAKVNNLSQSILAKAFKGELTADWRAANPDLISGENSAEALLQRIKEEREKLNPVKKAKTKATRKKA